MNGDSPQEKRRKWKRYRISGGAVVVLQQPLLLGRFRSLELGSIIDMCMGGLLVQYIDNKDNQLDGCNTLSIAIPDQNIEISDLKFEPVRKQPVAEVAGKGKIYSLALKFPRLTPYQKYQIEIFLDTFGRTMERRRPSGSERRETSDPRFDAPEYGRLNKGRRQGDRRTG